MTNRKIKKAVKRLKHLPGGFNFFRYSFNKVQSKGLKMIKSVRVAHPSTLMLEVTNHCNLHCLTCPREFDYGKEMDKGFMDLNQLKKMVDESIPYIDSIGLTGLGEPTLYKDLVPAIDYVRSKSKGIILSLSTNASLSSCVEVLKSCINKIDTIQISIDGIGNVYNKVRINSNYDTFIENVREIKRLAEGSDTDVMLNAVIVKENYHQMSMLVQLAHDLGIRFLNFTLYNLASDTINSADYYQVFYSAAFKEELSNAYFLAASFKDLEFTTWDHNSRNGFQKCPFPWTHFFITWDGWLVPCCAKPFPKEKNFGNVFETSLMESLNAESFRDFRTLWYNNQKPGFCNKCHFTCIEPILEKV